MESQILEAAAGGAIEGVVLRYGLFYGPSNRATQELLALVQKRWLPRMHNDRGQLPFIHLDDAVTATVAALHRGRSGGLYDIVDDQPASFSEFVAELADCSGAPRPFVVPRWVLRLLTPYMTQLLTARVSMSNAQARRELAWTPQFTSYQDGLRHGIASAAYGRQNVSGCGTGGQSHMCVSEAPLSSDCSPIATSTRHQPAFGIGASKNAEIIPSSQSGGSIRYEK